MYQLRSYQLCPVVKMSVPYFIIDHPNPLDENK